MTTQMKRKIVRCIELKLSGKPFPLYIDHAGFAVSPERIASLEAECGDSLPADYKEFLLAYNGARLLILDPEAPKPDVSFLSNIKEVSDFGLLRSILEGVSYEKNSIVLIGSNHDGSVYTLMNVNGKRKGEIYQYHRDSPPDFLKHPIYKSFTELLQSLAKSEYAKHISKSGVVKSITIKSSSPPRDDDVDSKGLPIPINSKKYPLLTEVVYDLFEKTDTEENEYGRIIVKNKQEKRKIVLLMSYIRDILHEQGNNDIQSYLDFFSPFRMYLVSEQELEGLMKEGLITANDDITRRGLELAETIIAEESEKFGILLPKREHGFRSTTFKGYVEVILGGKVTPLQMTQIGTLINEARMKKFEKDLGNTLPKEYREFLLGYNGGVTRQSNLIIDGNIETAGIKMFRDIQTLEDRLYSGGSQTTIEWMAIGVDKNEHLVYINLLGDKRGYIYRYKYDEADEEGSTKTAEGFTDAPKQLLAKSFLEFVLNVVEDEEEWKEEKADEEYLEQLLSEETKMKFPQFVDVLWTVYEMVEKQEGKYGRVTITERQDLQNVILLVKYLTMSNSESFVTALNHTPFRFFTILDANIDDLKKAKLLDKNGKITKRGREEVERILIDTKVIEPKHERKGKDKKKEGKTPKTSPKAALEKKRKLEKDETEGRATRSSTKEAKKR